MKTGPSKLAITIAAIALLIGVGSLAQSNRSVAGSASDAIQRECPYLLVGDAGCTVEVASMIFTDEVHGTQYVGTVPDEDKDKFRFAIVTLKITKPAGKRLALAAADLTLHYYHGQETEVCACEGLSWFKTNNDGDTPPQMNRFPGPGWIKQTTGARCTQDTVAYIDAVFRNIEPDTKECWICVAQPVTRQPSHVCPSPAWSN